MEIFKLFGSIFVDNEKANESIHKTEEKAEGLGTKLTKGVGTAIKWGSAIAGGAVVAIGGMVKLAEKTAQSADVIDKLSERTGVNREELQRWKYAAEQSGADVGKLELGVKKLSGAMDGASSGSKSSIDAFEKLGISMQDVQSKSPSDMLDTVMKKLADMPDSVERNALGNQLLGKSYQDMLPLLNSGSKGIEELKGRADELGLVMSEDMVKANVKFGDTLADVKNSFSAVFMHIANKFLPILQQFLDFILKYMPQIQQIFSVVFGVIGKFSEIVIKVIKDVFESLDNLFNGTSEESKKFQNEFNEFKKWFEDIFKTLVEIAKVSFEILKGIWDKYGDDIVKLITIAFTNIKTVIDTTLKIIKGILDVILGIITGDWEKVWNGLKSIVISVFEGIAKILPNMLEGIAIIITGAGKILWDAGASIFNKLWDGLKSVWSNITSWVNDGIAWLSDKLTFWDNGTNKINSNNVKSNSNTKVHGSHADGLNYVPFDGYIAQLHKGERVLTADENKKLNSYVNYTDMMNKILSAINILSQEIQNQPYKQRQLARKEVV